MLLIFFRLAPGSEPLDLASLVIIRFLGVPRYAVCYFHWVCILAWLSAAGEKLER